MKTWLIWGLGALFYAYEFFLQVSPGVMVPDLMFAFKVNAGALGNLAAFYFYAYAVMQIPAGVFLDILGSRRLLTIAVTVCAIGAFIFAMATHLWIAKAGRLLIGLGSAFAAIGTLKLGADWFPTEKFGYITGLTVMLGMLGAVVGGSPLALLVATVGWRSSMGILALIGIVVAFLIWFIVRDHPSPHAQRARRLAVKKMGLWPSLSYIFKQKQSWIVSCYGGLMFAPTSAFAALWGVPFLMATYGFHRPVAAGAISMIFIGWIVGSPTFGFISDFLRQRKPTLYIGSVGALIAMLLILYVHLHVLFLYMALFAFGLFSAGFLPSFSIIREINPPHTNATALGFMNMLNMSGGAILQPVIGIVLDHYWDGRTLQQALIYSPHSYYIALAILPIIIFIALALVPFIKETHCKQIVLN